MSVCVLIVTYNNEDTIADCLNALKHEAGLQVVVIDNASQDKTLTIAKKYGAYIIHNRINLGYAKANNLGFDYAQTQQADYALVLNPDTVGTKGFIQKLVKAATQRNNKVICGPKIVSRALHIVWSAGGELDKKRYTAGLIDYGKADRTGHNDKEVDFVSGTCMLVPKSATRANIRFYEPYYMYYEDVEFCVKARALGFPSVVVPSAKIIHTESSSLGSFRKSKEYYLARNHLLFVERNAPFGVQLRELVRMPKTLLEHSLQKNNNALRGISDYAFRRFGSGTFQKTWTPT